MGTSLKIIWNYLTTTWTLYDICLITWLSYVFHVLGSWANKYEIHMTNIWHKYETTMTNIWQGICHRLLVFLQYFAYIWDGGLSRGWLGMSRGWLRMSRGWLGMSRGSLGMSRGWLGISRDWLGMSGGWLGMSLFYLFIYIYMYIYRER